VNWHIDVPPGTDLININDHLHHYERARRSEVLKDITWRACQRQRIPPLAHAWVFGEYFAPNRRRKDAGNWLPTAKALVDGVTLCPECKRPPGTKCLATKGSHRPRVLADDDFRYVTGPDMRLTVAPETSFSVLFRLHVFPMAAPPDWAHIARVFSGTERLPGTAVT
jgi:hypothetical protein